jgi:hypothetical protein
VVQEAVSNKALSWSLGLLFVAAAAAFAVLLNAQNAKQQDALWTELGKGLIQLAVIGVLGTVLKLLADGHQTRRERADRDQELRRERADRDQELRRERAERNHEFRSDKRRRLVNVTNALRKAPILIQAHRSTQAWTDQMLTVIEAGYELRAIKHEIHASKTAPNPPFQGDSARLLIDTLESMQTYIEWVVHDYQRKETLDELQRAADDEGLSPEQRRRRREAIWKEICSLDGFRDMMASLGPRESAHLTCRYEYELNYQKAINRITRESLAESAGEKQDDREAR